MSLPWFRLPEPPTDLNKFVIIGAGLAGCWLARELAMRGAKVQILEKSGAIASGASANPVGIAKPFVTRQPSEAHQFYQAAFAHLLNRLSQSGLGHAARFKRTGVLQLVKHNYPLNKAYRQLTAFEAGNEAGVPIGSSAIAFDDAGWLNPHAMCTALCEHAGIDVHLNYAVEQIRPDNQGGWNVSSAEAKTAPGIHAQNLILANGMQLPNTQWTDQLPLVPARGQISRFALHESMPGSINPLIKVISGKHYAIADGNTVLVGATFNRHDTDTSVRDSDHAENHAALEQLLPSIAVYRRALEGYAGVRATTPDRLPIVGPAPNLAAYQDAYATIRHGRPFSHYPEAPIFRGLYLLGGLGSRGIVSAPYCAALLAEHLCNRQPSALNQKHGSINEKSGVDNNASGSIPTLQSWASLLHPARFSIRELKRR